MRWLVLASLLFCAHVSAQEYSTPSHGWRRVEHRSLKPLDWSDDDQIRPYGMSLIVGVPDGIAPSLSIHPGTNALHIDLGPSAILSMGGRAAVTLDPFRWNLSPTLTLAGGIFGWADTPGHKSKFQASWASVQPGVELGIRSRWRFFMRCGVSWIWVKTQGAVIPPTPSLQIQAPRGFLVLFPSPSIGLSTYF